MSHLDLVLLYFVLIFYCFGPFQILLLIFTERLGTTDHALIHNVKVYKVYRYTVLGRALE